MVCADFPGPALSSASEGTPYNRSGVTSYPYAFSILSASTGIFANDFTFELQNGNGTTTKFVFVGLVGVSDCWVGSYTMDWTPGVPSAPPSGAVACESSGPRLTSQVMSGDELVLVTDSSISDHGYALALMDQSTTVTAAIP